MKDEVRLRIQRVDLIHRDLESSIDIGISCLVEPDVTVADLYEREVLGARLGSAQKTGRWHARRKAPHDARSSPLHAFQEASPVDIALEGGRGAFQFVFFVFSHSECLSVAALAPLSYQETGNPANLFPHRNPG